MTLELFAHPFSSYCQKALTALYENDTPFTYRELGPDKPETAAEFARLWPLARFPVLRDGDRVVVESSTIIEYLDVAHPGDSKLIPEEPDAMIEARMLDRVFDNYVMTPMSKFVFDVIRPEGERDAFGVSEAAGLLDKSYAWLDGRLAGRTWAIGDSFSIADCAAAPSLFYADWVRPIDERFGNLRGYRERLLERPSFARAVDEARPYRALFPLGAPARD